MELVDIVESIRSEMGGDVIALAISEKTIQDKIMEALRKVGSYSPKIVTESFNVVGEKVVLPEGTMVVHEVLSMRDDTNLRRGGDEVDIFNTNSYMNHSDPLDNLIKKSELDNIRSFSEVTDWYYVKDTRTVFFNYYNRPTATIKYLMKYSNINEVTDDSMLDIIKNYALALCKISEGNIRRKLSQVPGAMMMDGSELVQEGKEEKDILDDLIKKEFSNIRFGIRF